MHATIVLSKLVMDRKNPRRVKPERDAHRRLVASIRAFGLLEPLVVRPVGGESDAYLVIAGQRRLAALRELHRNDKTEPKIACQVRKVDDPTAEAMALSENFAREAMHPLDEAEAFAKRASLEGKGAEVIAIEFGVTAHYVRQRMKLATLAEEIKSAYRAGGINTSIAEAFTSVPRERQLQIWTELNGAPRHAEQVRRVIASSWIEVSHAIFDISALPDSAVSRDLFNEQVLVERTAFLKEQATALESQRAAMMEDGWKDVIVSRHEDAHDKLFSMDTPEREFDRKTAQRLEKIHAIREKLEGQLQQTGEGDPNAVAQIHEKFDALNASEQELMDKAPVFFSEATKSVATAFLLLGPDGAVRREYRVEHKPRSAVREFSSEAGDATAPAEAPPTSDDLSDKQLATLFHEEALAVRTALLNDAGARKRFLILLLHEEVRSEAVAIHHDVNGTTLHAMGTEDAPPPALNPVRQKRAAIDPFAEQYHVDDVNAYTRLHELSDSQMNALIAVLTVESLIAHPLRRLELVQELARELKVNVRDSWRPDVTWLSSYQKIQLTHLTVELRGAAYSAADDRSKKSEMVRALADLFSDAAEGKVANAKLAERVNRWLPPKVTETPDSP